MIDFRQLCRGVMITACLTGWSVLAIAGEKPGSLLKHLPPGGIAAVETSGLEPLMERVQTGKAYREFLESPAYRTWADSNPGKKFRGGQAVVEAQLGQDSWTLAKNYLGRRMSLAIYPPANRSQPDGVLLIEAKDAAAVAYLKEKLKPLLSLAGDAVTLSERPDGGWQVAYPGDNTAVLVDQWILSSNNPSLLEMTIQRLREPMAESLADDEQRRRMIHHMGAEHLVQGWVDLAWIQKQQGRRLLPEKLDNPLGSLLLGGLLELAANAPCAGLTLDVGEADFRLTVGAASSVKNLGAAHRGFFQTPETAEVVALPKLAGLLGGFSMYCDVQAWYQQREALLVPQLMPEFDKFETGLSNLLPGKDFGTEVLPLFGKRWTLVAAPQSFTHLGGKPGVQLPAFGLLIDLAKPEQGADLMQMLFQTITAIVNIEAGQKGRQPWVVTSETYRDVQISFAKYLDLPKGDSLPIAYNFQPAMARVGNRFLAATSRDFCRSLIDALTDEMASSRSAGAVDNLVLELSPTVAADLLLRNESLLLARSVQTGKSTDQAQTEIKTLLEFLNRLEPVRLRTLFDADTVRLELHGGWK